MFVVPMYASASRKTSSTASEHRFLLLIVAVALALALLPATQAMGQAVADPPAVSGDPVADDGQPDEAQGIVVDPDPSAAPTDPPAVDAPVTESEPLITEAEPLIVAPPVVDPPVEAPPVVDPPPAPVDPPPPPVEEPPVATPPAPEAPPVPEAPPAAETSPVAAAEDGEVVVAPVKGPDRPNTGVQRGPRPDIDADVAPGTKLSTLNGPAIGASGPQRTASVTGGDDAPAVPQALPTFRPDSPELPSDAQLAATATAGGVAALRSPLGQVKSRVLDLTPAEVFVSGAGAQSLLPAGSADAIPMLDRPATEVPGIAGAHHGAVAARREELRPTVGLGALAGYFARSSSEAGTGGATLLDALASRIVPGGGGATIPTLLLVFTAALALALSLPRAPRRIGRIIDADWATLDGFRTSPARPG